MTFDPNAVANDSTPPRLTRENIEAWEAEYGIYTLVPPPGRFVPETDAMPAVMGHYVTAYATDLQDDALLGQLVVVGGLIREYGGWPNGPDAVELADLQGRVLVTIPRYADGYVGLWSSPVGPGQVVLVAGVVTEATWPFGRSVELRRGTTWEQAARMGSEAFALGLDALDLR